MSKILLSVAQVDSFARSPLFASGFSEYRVGIGGRENCAVSGCSGALRFEPVQAASISLRRCATARQYDNFFRRSINIKQFGQLGWQQSFASGGCIRDGTSIPSDVFFMRSMFQLPRE